MLAWTRRAPPITWSGGIMQLFKAAPPPAPRLFSSANFSTAPVCAYLRVFLCVYFVIYLQINVGVENTA